MTQEMPWKEYSFLETPNIASEQPCKYQAFPKNNYLKSQIEIPIQQELLYVRTSSAAASASALSLRRIYKLYNPKLTAVLQHVEQNK